MIGLGKMGGNMAERLRRAGHNVVGYDRDSDGQRRRRPGGAGGAAAGAARRLGDGARRRADPGDDQRAGRPARRPATSSSTAATRTTPTTSSTPPSSPSKGIGFVDCGVSGGVWGLQNGYALMVGGDDEHVARVQPIFDALKPEGEYGFVHAGKVGAGHFAKMVHNGIEYGMMQAYAEGCELLRPPTSCTDVAGVLRSWRQGTVIRSWLLDLLVRALDEDPDLAELRGYAQDSGEGRWTVQAAVDHAVPMPVITAALFARFASRQDDSPAMKVVAALRNQFGGHAVTAKAGAPRRAPSPRRRRQPPVRRPDRPTSPAARVIPCPRGREPYGRGRPR